MMLQVTRSRFTAYGQRIITAAALTAVLLSAASTSALADPTAPDGIWYTDGQESIIKVHSCTDDPSVYCGTMVWLKEPTESDGSQKIDKLNKDPAKKNKPLIGMDILLNMKSNEDHWSGKAYNPEDGKFYDITFKVKDTNDAADLRGCLGGGMLTKYLCRTETFNRAKEVPGGDPTLTAAGTTAKKSHKPKKDASVH